MKVNRTGIYSHASLNESDGTSYKNRISRCKLI